MPENDPSRTTPAPAVVCPTCGERSAAGLRFCPRDGSRLEPAPPGAGPIGTRKAPPSLVGKVLADRYRLVRKIGEGGMGEVYEAQHVYIDKRVAIKTLRAEILANPEAVSRFQQEARAASTIGHQNIVAIEDFGQLEGGAVYMAMEYLDGSSLAERVRRGPPLQRGEIFDVMKQVCRGLGAAHDKGIIHRDMKPENIFLARGQREKAGHTVAKILDFGIAKVQHEGGAGGMHLTQTGAVFGTPFYMSPEQALGKPLDARADVYSVGVILYELFAGRVPFEGDSFMAILSQHITAAPTPPSRMAPPDRPVPPAFERLILQAMSKDRDKRFASMRALGDALDDAERRAAAETLEPLDPALPAPAVELAELPANRRAALLDEPMPEVPRTVEPRRLAAWAVAGALVVLLAVAGTVALRRAGRASNPPAITAVSVADPIRGALPVGASGSEGVATTDIVLDSIPSGAKVFAGGRLLCETPDALKIPVGTTLEVLLHRDGFISKQLTIDPARDGRKVMVRLERDPLRPRNSPPSPSPSASPTTPRPLPPPAPTKREHRPAKPEPAPAPAHAPVLHPPPAEHLYQALPPPPPKRPPGGGTPRPAPLDPYTN